MRGGIIAQRARVTTAGHLGTLQVSLRGLMDQSSPEVPLIDPPSGDACLCFVLVVGQCGMHQQDCASLKTAVSISSRWTQQPQQQLLDT